MHRLVPTVLGLGLAFASASAGWTQPLPAAPPADQPAAAEPQAMSLDELAAYSGGDAVHVDLRATQQLTATSSGNSVTANTVNSGDVAFASDALSGFSGIGNFVINTGANNNLQGSISVNIVTVPLP